MPCLVNLYGPSNGAFLKFMMCKIYTELYGSERNMDDFDDSNKPLSSQPVVKHYPDSYMYTYGNSITAKYDQCVIPSNNCDNIRYIGQIWYMNMMNYHL